MKLTQLQQLKQKLLKAADLSEIWLFYMDNFADVPDFIEVGEPKQNDFLEAAVPQICQQMFGRKTKVTNLLLIYIAEYQFFHAPFHADNRIGGLIYFEDINTGLLAVSAEFPPTDVVKYSRFSSPPQSQASNFYNYN